MDLKDRIDAWHREGLALVEAAEQARVKGPCLCTHDPSDIRPGAVLRYEDCCRKKGIKFCQPAPVVERFVMWDKDETVESATRGLIKRDDWFTRRKRGYVVAKRVGEDRWDVTLPDGDTRILTVGVYLFLKRNGCFGEQVK